MTSDVIRLVPPPPPLRGGGRPKSYRTSSGERVPSVTTILSRFRDSSGLIAWAMREGMRAEQIRDEAANTGSVVHDMVEEHIHGGKWSSVLRASSLSMEQVREARLGFISWLRWHDAAPRMYVATEVPLASDKYRFGGTIDAVARDGDSPVIIDWKTSKRTYIEHVYQAAAYAQLWGEHSGELPEDVVIVRIPKDGSECVTSHIGGEALALARKQFLRLRMAYDDDAMLRKFVGL